MPVVENEVIVAAPIEHVYTIAKDVETFPSYMPDVESVVVQERSADGSRTVTDWVGLIPEFKQKIRWTEEDIWDDETHTCRFHQLKGEYQQYEGEWMFRATSEGTLFRSLIQYNLEIPLIGPLIKKLVAKKMKDNTDKILQAIKQRAEETI